MPIPRPKTLEVPSSLQKESSNEQQDSMRVEGSSTTMEKIYQGKERSQLMPSTTVNAKLSTVSRAASEQLLQSSSSAGVPMPPRKRPGGYEWMFPARATLPRVTATQSGPYPAASSQSGTSKECNSLQRLKPSHPADARVHRSSAQTPSSDDEDYEVMKTSKRQPPR